MAGIFLGKNTEKMNDYLLSIKRPLAGSKIFSPVRMMAEKIFISKRVMPVWKEARLSFP
jgi:hypothetical protein